MLSSEVLAYFVEGPVESDELAIDRYPGMSDFEQRLVRWRSGERVGATLLVGRTGYGKTSWLFAARTRLAGDTVHSIVLRERATTEEEVARLLGRAIGAPDSTRIADDLIQLLRAGGRRVITVDEAQLFFLRGVGRLEGWRAFTRILERTSDNVLWIVAFAHYPWEILSWVAKGEHAFRTIVHLTPWSEPEIAELLDRRTRASKLTIAYDDLLVEGVGSEQAAQVVSTARDYDRLIWDYAEGSPRVALHVWGRSLIPDGSGRARVRLFANPDVTALESLSEAARFVLAAIVWHERLSLEEAMAVSLSPPAVCEDAFERFVELGAAEVSDGRLRITARWWPAVVRYLRRKHLIET